MKKIPSLLVLVASLAIAGCRSPGPTESAEVDSLDLKIEPVYGETNPKPDALQAAKVKRFGSVIGLHPEKEEYYRELHANVWPGVVERLRKSHIRNYSIYTAALDGKKYLFSYFEYVGEDFDADMKAIGDDPLTQKWWKETDPCQIPLPTRKPGARWSDLEMVFFMD